MSHLNKSIIHFEPTGSEELYTTVRSAFVARGYSLNRWCIANGVNRQTAEKALRGHASGRQARHLLRSIVDAAMPGLIDAALASEADR